MASILIVDDEKNIRKQLYWHLSDDFDVYEASTSKEAKKIIDKKQIQIALIDLHMAPNLDSIKSGIEVLTYLNAEIPDAIGIHAG
jgi:DNA-binding response OmpR family regulator